MVRPRAHLLQLRAENENGLDLTHSMQSSGHEISSFNLFEFPGQYPVHEHRFTELFLPIALASMGQVRHYYLPCLLLSGHFHVIFTWLHDELEPPEAIFLQPESTADRRSIRVAKESELLWKE
jgi:hypothetical protein